MDLVKRLNELLEENKTEKMTIDIFKEKDGYFKSIIDKASDSEREEIEKELNKFCAKNEKCIFTGKSPYLSWALAHGIMIDEETGLSWKAIHYFIINEEKVKITYTMQYHPEEYSVEKSE